MSQVKGFLTWTVFICFVNPDAELNLLPHCGHKNVWVGGVSASFLPRSIFCDCVNGSIRINSLYRWICWFKSRSWSWLKQDWVGHASASNGSKSEDRGVGCASASLVAGFWAEQGVGWASASSWSGRTLFVETLLSQPQVRSQPVWFYLFRTAWTSTE